MKTILALALFGAAVLFAQGEEFSVEHVELLDALEDPHRRGGRPRPTPPEFVRKCLEDAKECLKNANDDCAKVKCVKEFRACVKPTAMPSRLPKRLEDCKEDAKKCWGDAGDDCTKQLACIKKMKECVHPAPEFVRQCGAKAKECIENAGDDASKKLVCAMAFAKCLRDNRPTVLPSGVPRPVKICLAAAKRCLVDRRKPACLILLKCRRGGHPRPRADEDMEFDEF